MLTTIRKDACRDVVECPALHRADSDELIVQGYKTDREDTIRVPASLIPEWAMHLARTSNGDLLIAGRVVTDASLLAELDLPAGESAVVVDHAVLPALEAVPC